MKLGAEINAARITLDDARRHFLPDEAIPTAIFSRHHRAIREDRLEGAAPTPIPHETLGVPVVDSQREGGRTKTGKKIKPRYTKRAMRLRMKKLAAVKRQILQEFNDPAGFLVDQDAEMRLIVANGTGKPRLVVIDIDGTLIPYQTGKRKHSAPSLRPFYQELVSFLKKEADLFLFSSASPTRTKNLFLKYFSADFCGYFDRTHLKRGRKCLEPLQFTGQKLLIIDDDPSAVHQWSESSHLCVPRWFGDSADTSFKDVVALLQEQWSAEKSAGPSLGVPATT